MRKAALADRVLARAICVIALSGVIAAASPAHAQPAAAEAEVIDPETPLTARGPFASEAETIAAISVTLPLGLGGVIGGSFLLQHAKYAATEEGERTLAALGLGSWGLGAGIAAFGALVLIDFVTDEPSPPPVGVIAAPIESGAIMILSGRF